MITIKTDDLKQKKKVNIMKYLPAVILLLYPLRNAARGLDLMDAGYALGNYRFFGSMDQMWKLATYLANVTGVLLSKLPFGDSWIGMNVYCGLLTGMVAAAVYLFLYEHYGKEHKGISFLLFLAELAAMSLCWSPVVILYHYLGYLLMTIATMMLFNAITKDNTRYYIAAGVILGLCVAVRMPNVTYMAFIVPLWCWCFWNRQKDSSQEGKQGTWFQMLLRRTLLCIGGYFVGLLVPIAVICVRYGVTAYPQMISSLFGMTDNATDYKPTSMVMAMFGDYIQYSVWLLLFFAYMIVGMLVIWGINRFLSDKIKTKITIAFKILYTAGLLSVLRFCYGRGMFNFDYSAYFSMYKWVTVYLLIVIVLCIWCFLHKNSNMELKLWSVFLLVTILITPLGSNNGLYPIINNLFLVAPVSVLLLAEVFVQSRKSAYGLPLRITLNFVLLCTAVQSILFGIGFVFHDVGVQTDAVRLQLKCSQAADGLTTTPEKKAALEELDHYLYENDLQEKQVILYGDIPALAYLFDMEPAIFSTWADLDSKSIDILKTELDELSKERNNQELPVVIFGRSSVERLTKEDGLAYQKLELIQDFLEKNGYGQTFCNTFYIVCSVSRKNEQPFSSACQYVKAELSR